MKESPGSSDGSGVGSIADENQATMPSFSQITHHGAIALPIHRVEYAVRSRGIAPAGIAGNLRVFDEDAVRQVAAALRLIATRREGDPA